ncbi:hypothetical protein HPB49_023045 [Dermacentor silvarum]|uniref:Uncharacterized protein n=1 Tax=Dermacentor silvarum TaxID=543639 RepID=A0ACB8CTL7_DERSI|nr:uncharacterized protein LOC119452275 [Dermacentor silvarum]KAH7950358.1 hypothetical protein HPB49_023045 [Dermacentor silvarum]
MERKSSSGTLLFLFIGGFLLLVKAESNETGLSEAGPTNRRISIPTIIAQRHCKWNEKWKWCQSPNCAEWRCEYVFSGFPKKCRFGCVSKCFCRPGFFRDYEDKCVGYFRCLYHRKRYQNNRQE